MQIDARLAALREISQRKLIDILEKISGKKDLIIDYSVLKPLDRLIPASVLKNHNVDKTYKLENSSPAGAQNLQRLYLIKSDLITAKRVCDQVNADLRQNKTISYHIILVPRRLSSIEQLLEEEGIWGSVQIHVFPWEPIQLDFGLLSLEMPSIYPQLFIDGDQTLLPAVAQSLWSLQMLLGHAQTTLCVGRYAKQVLNMTEMRMDMLGRPEQSSSDLGCVILIDRDADYASTLLTPATYTSLLDEVLGIQTGVVNLPKTSDNEKTNVKHLLSSQDEIYNQIKNRHFSDVFSFLSSKAKELTTEQERCQKMHIQEMKEYVSTRLKTVMSLKQFLAIHIAGCEAIITAMGQRFEGLQTAEQNMLSGTNRRSIITYIEECLATGRGGKLAILRLLCLLYITQDSISSEDLWSLKTQFLHAYGYNLLPGLSNLERAGLLPVSTSDASGTTNMVVDATGRLATRVAQVVSLPRRSTFQMMTQRLKLTPAHQDDLNLKQPTDMSYVFNGAYIPLACQLVQMIAKKEVTFDDIVNKLLPGSSVTPAKANVDFIPRTFLVYFIGGVAYAEVAAFQLLEKLTGTRIIVVGTSVINGSALIDSAL